MNRTEEVIVLNEAFTMKQKGQIHVILNQKQEPLQEPARFFLNEAEREKHSPLEKIENEMSALVGMDELKRLIKEIYAWLYINQCREAKGLKVERQALHMLFKGNPGTGKTTVARLLGKLFYEMNVLSKGHLVEVERGDLVGEYIGHTAQKTRELVKKAMGGILFIDEAYSLARGGEKDFGKEAIDTLVKQMEDKQHDFLLILAGYSHEMEYFLKTNPGLPSRFPIMISFPDYNVNELMKISRKMVAEREYVLTQRAEQKLEQHLQTVKLQNRTSFSNGRYVRNIIEKAIRSQSVRLLREGDHERERLLTLREEDFKLTEAATV
ncbi:MAG TPA: stage V sporulation protein K [Bacillales bacterium]|nr:stage V sporulation protein K [Bacillales bacterium]